MQEYTPIKLQADKNLHLTFNSAFKPIHQWKNMISELEAHGQQIINQQRLIPLCEFANEKCKNPLAQLIKNMIFSLYLDLSKSEQKEEASIIFKEFKEFSFELYKVICLMCNKNLFELGDKYYEELSSSMIFQKSLMELFKRCFLQKGQNNCYLSFDELDWILVNLTVPDYKQKFRDQLYCMCGGTFMTIEQSNFTQTLKFIAMNIGKYFTQKSTFLTKHLKVPKKSKQITEIVNNSIKIICNYKNQVFLSQEVTKISQFIFSQETIDRLEFINKVSSLDKKGPNNLLWIYIDLLRVQCIISMDPGLSLKLKNYSAEAHEPNFYVQEMQKLLNKCPYNGDDCCMCKKCQCVRRNRESAKLSQEKKRNAVEQLNPLKIRVKELEIRNLELEEQNQILRGIVEQMKDHPAFRQMLSSTLEPMSKIINDDN